MEVVQDKHQSTESRKIWGKKVIDAGFVQLPTLLFRHQRELGLDAIDMNIILQLASFWWRKDSLPRPTRSRLAEALGLDVSTIRRRITRLEKGGYLTRHIRSSDRNARRANEYDLSGLIAKLQPLAEDALAKKQAEETRKGRRALAKAAVAVVQPPQEDQTAV